MKYNSLMHISFVSDNFDEMLDFYQNILGFKLRVLVKYKEYLNREDRPKMQEIARKYPDKIFNAYLEIVPGQFIELFPSDSPVEKDNKNTYSHFALVVEDIYEAFDEINKKGIAPDTKVTKGPSETYQFWMHDPDGNKFEFMQYTDKSYQIIGHISEW